MTANTNKWSLVILCPSFHSFC